MFNPFYIDYPFLSYFCDFIADYKTFEKRDAINRWRSAMLLKIAPKKRLTNRIRDVPKHQALFS